MLASKGVKEDMGRVHKSIALETEMDLSVIVPTDMQTWRGKGGRWDECTGGKGFEYRQKLVTYTDEYPGHSGGEESFKP